MKNWVYYFEIYTKNAMTTAKTIGEGNQDLENYLVENKMRVKSMSVVKDKGVDRIYVLLENDV
ncbi:MAG: hypothetical protein ACW99A_03310 [Candidatus Kariarchaeaceae archaeon]|jgi:hypothetical protein